MNELKNLTAFQQVLKNYQPSPEAQRLLQDLKLVLLAAPTSTGRNTVIRQLLSTDKYYFIISDTTRQPRVNDGILEQNGREYWFRGEEDVLQELQKGEFLEAAIVHEQQVSGISMRELRQAQEQGKIATTDIEINGVDNIMKVKPDTVAIFMLPSSFEEWQRRIHERGTMEESELYRRLEGARRELSMALDQPYYTFVINENLHDTVQEVDRLAHGLTDNAAQQKRGRELARELHDQTTAFLRRYIQK